MERGKIRVDKHFLPTLNHYLHEGWKLSAWTKKDTDGFYWFILQRNRQQAFLQGR